MEIVSLGDNLREESDSIGLLALPLGVIGGLCSMIMALPEHLLYKFLLESFECYLSTPKGVHNLRICSEGHVFNGLLNVL